MKVFLTGGTGFVGQYILLQLLSRGHRVWVLYRDEEKRLDTSLFITGRGCSTSTENLTWLEGDIQQVDLLWDKWRKSNSTIEGADTVIHCVASLRFSVNDSGEPFKTNVGGAEALLRLIAKHPMQVHLLSTAYVCGYVGQGLVREEFHEQVSFNNAYEQSKWEVEKLWLGQATLLRPSVVVGDSVSGRCTSFTGWYIPVKALQALDALFQTNPSIDRSSFDISVPADPSSEINIVPVDYVARATVAIAENPSNHNKIFHLTHPEPPTFEWNQEVLSKRFNFHGIKFVGRDAPLPQARNEFHSFLLESAKPVLKYFSNAPQFNRINTEKAIPDLRVPPITERYIDLLIDYGIDTDWGRNPGRV